MLRITKRVVDAALPQDNRRSVIWNADLKGFGLHIGPTGTKTYIVRYRPKNIGRGAPKRLVVLGRHGPLTPDEARGRARTILGEVAAGRDPAQAKEEAKSTLTVTALVEVFLDHHVKPKRKAGTAKGYRSILNAYLLPKLGKRSADKVTSADIAHIHLAMRDRPYAANRFLAVTASMYAFAIKRKLLPKGSNPVEEIERYRESHRERYLSAAELRRLGDTLRLAESEGLP